MEKLNVLYQTITVPVIWILDYVLSKDILHSTSKLELTLYSKITISQLLKIINSHNVFYIMRLLWFNIFFRSNFYI
jgi:hypothetical protein